MIVSDLLGVFQAFTPKFVKKYANLGEVTLAALTQYAQEVRGEKFPADQHTYKMIEGELPRLMKELNRK